MPFASFRNTNGGRMNMVGVGIDSDFGPGPMREACWISEAVWGYARRYDGGWGATAARFLATNTGAVGLGVLSFNAG